MIKVLESSSILGNKYEIYLIDGDVYANFEGTHRFQTMGLNYNIVRVKDMIKHWGLGDRDYLIILREVFSRMETHQRDIKIDSILDN